MANIKSAQKRISTIERRNKENKFVKATLSTKVKKFRKMLEEGKIAEAETFSKEVYSYIDSACSKGVIHKNNASRKIGRLAAALYKAKTTTTEVKVEVEEKVEEKVETPVEEKKAPAKRTTKKAVATETEEKPVKKTTTRKTTKKAE